ncbi:MAG: FAD-dependent oxidoreductase [Ahrensia sp.]|nr:FAD-dependent oxidoreductase [Ahrensia sp.]
MITIIGAGIAGLSLAWELTKRGAEVTVLEAGTVASGASGVATCYLEPRLGDTPMRRLERASLSAWPDFVAVLEAESGTRVGFRDAGQLRVALPADVEQLETNTAERKAEGTPFQRLAVTDAIAREPAISHAIGSAVFLPHVRWVNGRLVCTALARALRARGAVVLEHASVAKIEEAGVVSADGRRVNHEKLVLCNAMGANALFGRPADMPEARAVRGVNLVLDMSGLGEPIRHMIKHRSGNMVPADETRLIVGTTYEAGVESLDVDPSVIERLYAHAEPILPGVRDLPLIEVNAGLRTKVADGKVRLGRSKISPDVYFSLGHAGSGYLRAPVIAPGFARYILDGEVSDDLTGVIPGTAAN